jgi:hypothetical protein
MSIFKPFGKMHVVAISVRELLESFARRVRKWI